MRDGQTRCGQILVRISRDPHDHKMKVSSKYLDCFPSFKVVLKLSDHGHFRSWLGEVRLDEVSLGLINDLRGTYDHILKVSGRYLDFFPSFKVVLKLSDHAWSC